MNHFGQRTRGWVSASLALFAAASLGGCGQESSGEPLADAGLSDTAGPDNGVDSNGDMGADDTRTDAPVDADDGDTASDADVSPTDASLDDTDTADMDAETDTPTGDADPPGPIPSPGCDMAPPEGMTPGTHEVTDFSGGGRDDRVYVVTIPQDYDPARPYALTLGLHPGGNRARPYYDLDTTMAGESINVYPQSLNPTGLWDKTGDADIPYLDDLVVFFKDNFCVDERRVFVGGFSQGARMAASLGCQRGDVFRAVAALSAGPPGATEGDVSIEQCVGQTAYFHINGLEDPQRKPLLDYYIELWRTRNACTEQTEPFEPDPCIAYLGCEQAVVQCEPAGLGHMNWRPGGASPFGAWFLSF
jgi:predicted esterase